MTFDANATYERKCDSKVLSRTSVCHGWHGSSWLDVRQLILLIDCRASNHGIMHTQTQRAALRPECHQAYLACIDHGTLAKPTEPLTSLAFSLADLQLAVELIEN